MRNPDLAKIAEDYHRWTLRAYPMVATIRGFHDHDTEIREVSREAEDRKIAELREFVETTLAIEPEGLDHSDRVTRDLLIFEAGNAADALELRLAEMAVDHTSGIQALLSVLIPQLPIENAQHADDFIERFSKLPSLMAETNQRLAEGIASGRTPMRSTAEKTVEQLDQILAAPEEEDAFMTAMQPVGVDPSDWRDRLLTLVGDAVRPSLKSYRDMIADQVIPAARPDDRAGLCWLPDGEESYARLVRQHTSLHLDPKQVHEIGLRQIEKLDDEYRELGGDVLGTTDLVEIYSRLRDDPDLHFESGAAIVEASRVALARAKEEMVNWFGRLPKADCLVAETPMGPVAFYLPPPVDGSRPGMFFINTSDPYQTGRFEIEAITFHEGIPGHHLQLAISQELEDIPEFRKHALVTVYAEGWGLYTERLADEMGLYSSQLDRIGMLALDSLRAGRLVVDTGIHAMGWSRQQAVDYFRGNSPLSLGNIEEEVDRYINNPGQALAYMIGRLEIQRMRRDAEDALGDAFDIKWFHDAVLGSGLVPMETLDRIVKAWVESVQVADGT